MMRIFLSLFTFGAIPCFVTAEYFDAISAFGLLGSHFGVPTINASFDYVIVGGGTAGLRIATRLAEDRSLSVAVIEAGGFAELDNGNVSQIPGDSSYWVGQDPKPVNPLIDWLQHTEPMPGCAGRSIFYDSGKTLGGGSARNFMVYDRPPVGAMQRWADEVGDESYTFENFLPNFEKTVTFEPPSDHARPANASIRPSIAPYGNSTGPMHVSYFNWVNSFGSWASKGLRELGLPEATDFVSGTLAGYGYQASLLDQRTQTRSSSEIGCLRPALLANNKLVIYKQTLAKRIVFNGTTAMGVAVETGNVPYQITATKEVIVSAGVFRSPQLLMVSGVGPRDELDRLNISIVKDLPGVGQNLQDQPTFGPSYEVKLLTHSALSYDPDLLSSTVDDYNNNRTGMLTNTGADFLAYEKFPADLFSNLTKNTRASLDQLPSDWPDTVWTIDDGYGGYATNLLTDAPVTGKNYVSAVMALLSHFSRGSVTIASQDTSTNPVVDLNLLGDERDQDQAVALYKRARQLFASRELAPIVNPIESFPGLNVSTDAQILSLIQNSAGTIWHASCTCKMGKANDTMAVVDSQARVYGLAHLRVVDASAFPFLPPVHPTATIYALAQKIADLILAE